MENYLRVFDTEADYESVKDGLVYPTVSYTVDTDKLWFIKRVPSIQNQIKMVFSITEDDVNNSGGEMMNAWSSLYLFDSVTVDGVEQVSAIEEYDVNVEVQDGDEFKLTDESFISRPVGRLTINFNEPLNQDSNIAFAYHEKWEEDGESGQMVALIDTLDIIKEYYNYSMITTQDGRISSITLELGREYDESYQLGVSVHTYADDEDPYELILSKDNIIDINIKYASGNLYLYLPTTEARDYEVVATRYSNVTNMGYMFKYCENLTSIDLSSFDTSTVTNMAGMFNLCRNLPSIDLSLFNTSNVTDMSSMFSSCYGLTSLDVSSFDTSNVTNMSNMFFGCDKLTSLDLSNFNTSNVNDMGYMFSECNGLTSIDLRSFDTSNVTNMGHMFTNCHSLTSLDLSSFDTSNVTDMNWMFYVCRSLTSLDLSSFDTSNITNMSSMFHSCTSLTSVKMVNNVSALTNVSYMFSNINTTGTFYYNADYDYSKIIAKLPSTWNAVNINGGGAPM